MNKYYSPNESQMRTTVKGGDNYRYYQRRRSFVLRVVLTVVFLALWLFVFAYGVMDWSK
jgi:hypothetical protein